VCVCLDIMIPDKQGFDFQFFNGELSVPR